MPVKPFGLTENPFAAGHDRRFICPSRKRDEAIALLRRHIAEGAPFIMVTGDPGIGKTSVVWEALGAQVLMAKLGFVTHSSLGRSGLLEAICLQFGVTVPNPPARNEMVTRLEQHLCLLRSRGRAAVLVLDDAHGAEPEQFEELRSLSEMKAEGRELLQIALVGLPELEHRLARPELERLRERVAVHCRILPFTPEETERYLHHRVTVAGGSGATVFPSETCREIHNYSYGFPRDINMLASRALDRAQRENTRDVLPDHVRASVAAARLRGETNPPRPAADVPSFPPAAAEPEPAASRPAVALPAPPLAAPRPTAALPPVPPVAPQRPAPDASRAGAAPPHPAPAPRQVEPLKWGRGIEPTVATRKKAVGALRSGLESNQSIFATPGRRRSESVLQVGLAAVVVAGLLVTVLLVMRSWDRGAPASDAPLPITAAPGGTGRVPAEPAVKPSSEVAARDVPTPEPAPPTPTPRFSTPAPEAVIPPPDVAVAPPEARRPAFGLEVASYIDAQRAATESERIAGATGQPCHVVTDAATDTYTVVLGAFQSQWAAERAANDLLGRDLVRQARVVALAGGDSTP